MSFPKQSEILPILELSELQEIFEYPNRRALNTALRTGALPLKTFWLRGRRVVHVAVVEKYFELMKEDGLAFLNAIQKYAEDHATDPDGEPDWDDN